VHARRSAGAIGGKIEALLERGRSLQRQGRHEDAVTVWRNVLALAPHEPRARDYLAYAGRDDDEREGDAVDRAELVRALKERRFEDALVLLEAARARAPEDGAIARGITAIRDHVVTRLARRLGGFEAILEARPANDSLAPEAQAVLDAIDGRATLGEVLARSQLDRYETCSMIEAMLRHGILAAAEPEPPPDGAFDRLFARATEAYLTGDYHASLRLYEACLALRPGDPTAAHNLARLEARVARER
jgi:tetratricopeptide (TPR) repeat protein